MLYVVHLALVLWWLLDRSAGQRATASLVAVTERALAPFALTLKLPPVRGLAADFDAAAQHALFGR